MNIYKTHTWLLVILMILILGSDSLWGKTENTLVEIEFSSPDADKATLIWGFRNWIVPPDFQYSPPTIYDRTLRTPFHKEGNTYSLAVEVPNGETLNWGILLGKEGRTHIKYYGQDSLSVYPEMDKVLLSTLIMEPKLTDLHPFWIILGCIFIWGLLFIGYRYTFS